MWWASASLSGRSTDHLFRLFDRLSQDYRTIASILNLGLVRVGAEGTGRDDELEDFQGHVVEPLSR